MMRMAASSAIACLLASGPFAGTVENPGPTAGTKLTTGSVIERQAAERDEHHYTIDLGEGEYLQAVIDQEGVDVWTTVTTPDGRTILKLYGHVADIGPDPIAVVATVAGTYHLTVLANESLAPPSRYVLRVEAVRDPTERDLLRVKTVQAMADAERLRMEPPRNARAELARERDALAGWEALGDRTMQMWHQLSIGSIHRAFLDEFRPAAEILVRALALSREVGDPVCEAKILYNLGHTEWRLGQFDQGQKHLEEAVALHRASGRRDKEAFLLMSIGRLLTAAGDLQPALDRLNEALAIHRSLDVLNRQADTQAILRENIGRIYAGLGDYELALEQYRLSVPARGADDKEHTARVIAATGAAYLGLGDLARARAAYADAVAIYRTLENRVLEAEISLVLGDVHREEGDLDAARAIFTTALEVLRSRGDPVGESKALCRLGEVQRRLGDRASARSAFEQAHAAAPAGSVLLGACAEEGLARLSADTGDLEAARQHAERALEGAESFRASVAGQRTRAATLATQQSLYELLVDLRMREHTRQPSAGYDAAAFETSERARARGLLELLAEGRIDAGTDVDPALSAEERSLRQRLNAWAQAHDEALARKRREQAESIGREIDDLTGRLAEVQARVRRASPHYARLTQPQPLSLATIRAQVLDADTQLLQYALGETRSYLWVVSPARLQSFTLAPRAEIERAARHLHELVSLPAAMSGDAGTPAAREAAMREMSRLLIVPAAGALTGKRLLVVAPGALQYVPFASLPLPDDPLVLARFELVSAPSASVIATLRNEARRAGSPRKGVAVFADPVFDISDPRLAAAARSPAGAAPVRVALRGSNGPGEPTEHALRGVRGTGAGGGLGRLPFSRQEADTIVALVPAKGALKATGFDANRAAATSPKLTDYRIVHFATHGVLNARRPELSGVVLSLFDERGRKQDGFLRLHDVYNLRLDADLVVLSGCQTALGKDLRGEGLVGLTRGFMYAGARAVVASLWQVDDESTAELMKRFYRAMLKDGRPPSEALRAAQLEMSRDRRWSAPFYWAGFVLQGEWR